MKKKTLILMLTVIAAGLVACKTMNSTPLKMKEGHGSLTEQQKLISCAECHKTATPEIHSQWYESTHGIGNVKCYQCHNTFENLVKTPDINQSCNSCHADKIDDKEHTEGLATCWECHDVHSFTAE